MSAGKQPISPRMPSPSFTLKNLSALLLPRMPPKNQRRVTAEEALEQTRRNRLRSAMFESRTGPVIPDDALKPRPSVNASTVVRLKTN